MVAVGGADFRGRSPDAREAWRALWFRTAVRGALLVLAYFATWEVAEQVIFEPYAYDLHHLHLLRGVGAAFLFATWSFLEVRRARAESEDALARQMLWLEAQIRHQEKMASLGVLAAGIAHDLGNPLASLSTELELLEGEGDVLRFRESLGVFRRHLSRMSRTLREMVDFARRRRDEVTDVSIELAVADSSRLVRHDPRWKKVELVVDVPPDTPRVRMVEDHLVLVLVNLMLNAADAMPSGGTLTISARARGRDVELCVRDTGAGMSPDVLAKAMTPLFTTKPHGQGTGLGLPVSGGILQSVGGSIRLSSMEGVGTEVLVRLPGASDGRSPGASDG